MREPVDFQFGVDLGVALETLETFGKDEGAWKDAWSTVAEATEPFQSKCVSAGTGFGQRDMQFEVASAEEAVELKHQIQHALAEAGLGEQIDYCNVTVEAVYDEQHSPEDDDVQRLAMIALQIWATGDAKVLSELSEETGFIAPTEEELDLGTKYSEYAQEAVADYIAANWKGQSDSDSTAGE